MRRQSKHSYGHAGRGLLVCVILLGSMGGGGVPTPVLAASGFGAWRDTGAMTSARAYQSALVLPTGAVLVAGGVAGTGAILATAELYTPHSGRWTVTGRMTAARAGITAILLPGGRVLVAGGATGTAGLGPVLRSAELYDPRTGQWTSTGRMTTERYNYAATLLPSGRVLVSGGVNTAGTTLTSAEVYDPATGRWTMTGGMRDARAGHTAALLPTGQVLVVGGATGVFGAGAVLRSAELYDPRNGRWTATGAMATARADHTATLLASGQVLVAGGEAGQSDGSGVVASAELYTPRTGRWSATSPMAHSRYNHAATRLPDGRVLVTGGQEESVAGHALDSAEIYDPRMGLWSAADALGIARTGHSAVLLPSGVVLLAGGNTRTEIGPTEASAQLYDPHAPRGAAPALLSTARALFTATLLRDGTVLAVGGIYAPPSRLSRSSAELYHPGTHIWTATGGMADARAAHTATLLPDGRVLVAGGFNSAGILASAELYNPRTGAWVATAPMHFAKAYHTATVLPNGAVLLAGGLDNAGATLSAAELYEPRTGTWHRTGSMAAPRASQTTTLLPNGRVLAVGGVSGKADRILASAEVYDPRAGRWSSTGALRAARAGQTATLLAGGRVLVADGQHNLAPVVALASAEIYTPGTGRWTSGGAMTRDRVKHTATLLPNGTVLVAGGEDSRGSNINDAVIFSPRTGSWKPAQGMGAAHAYHVATLLPNGTILVAGGVVASYLVLSFAEVYDPRAGRWASTGSM